MANKLKSRELGNFRNIIENHFENSLANVGELDSYKTLQNEYANFESLAEKYGYGGGLKNEVEDNAKKLSEVFVDSFEKENPEAINERDKILTTLTKLDPETAPILEKVLSKANMSASSNIVSKPAPFDKAGLFGTVFDLGKKAMLSSSAVPIGSFRRSVLGTKAPPMKIQDIIKGASDAAIKNPEDLGAIGDHLAGSTDSTAKMLGDKLKVISMSEDPGTRMRQTLALFQQPVFRQIFEKTMNPLKDDSEDTPQ